MALNRVNMLPSSQLLLPSLIATCKRNYAKGGIKEKNKLFKQQWNKENLTLFGPLMKNGKIQKPVTSTNQKTNKSTNDFSTVVHSESLSDLDESVPLPYDSAINSLSLGSDTGGEFVKEGNSKDFSQRLQRMLQFPLLPTDGSTNYIAATAASELDGLTEFSKNGEYHHAFPSVSKILEKSRPPESEFFLQRWMKNMIAELGEEGFKQHQKGGSVSECSVLIGPWEIWMGF